MYAETAMNKWGRMNRSFADFVYLLIFLITQTITIVLLYLHNIFIYNFVQITEI